MDIKELQKEIYKVDLGTKLRLYKQYVKANKVKLEEYKKYGVVDETQAGYKELMIRTDDCIRRAEMEIRKAEAAQKDKGCLTQYRLDNIRKLIFWFGQLIYTHEKFRN